MIKVKAILKTLVILIFISISTYGCSKSESLDNDIINGEVIDESIDITVESVIESSNADLFKGYTLIEVDGGDLSGHREPNVVVDIGYSDRQYYAFTNEYGQLIKVLAKEIILQNEKTETVTSKGRYYPDEAKVPGTEEKDLDEGHVIADSLGGVSNAYNITPQNSTLNRHGDQAYMEKVIRDAGGCTDFVAMITYPNTDTQIPSHYSITYTIKGNIINDEFDNVNSDEVNNNLIENNNSSNNQVNTSDSSNKPINITEIDKKAEYVIIKNISSTDVDLHGWKIVSVEGNQTFTFPTYIIKAGESIKVAGYDAKDTGQFVWEQGRGIWSNSKDDHGELYDSKGNLVHKY